MPNETHPNVQVWLIQVDDAGNHIKLSHSNDLELVRDVHARIRGGEQGSLPNRWEEGSSRPWPKIGDPTPSVLLDVPPELKD